MSSLYTKTKLFEVTSSPIGCGVLGEKYSYVFAKSPAEAVCIEIDNLIGMAGYMTVDPVEGYVYYAEAVEDVIKKHNKFRESK